MSDLRGEPLYVRSLRIASFIVCLLLGALAAVYATPASPDELERNYTRVWQFYQLGLGVALLLPVLQCVRSSGNGLYARLVPPPGPRVLADWWAVQSWGPLMVENVLYGLWLGLVWVFVSRYQVKLPPPEPWQLPHPPWAGVGRAQWMLLVNCYGSALLLTVAGAYSGLRRSGPLPVAAWLLLCVGLSAPAAALVVLCIFWLLARSVQEPPAPVSPGSLHFWSVLLLHLTVVLPLCLLASWLLWKNTGWRWLATGTLALGWTGALGVAVYGENTALPRPARLSVLEWVIVAFVVLVLAAILVPNFTGRGHGGRETMCKSNLKNIGTALEMYSSDFAGQYPPLPQLLTPNYLKTIPTCPAAGWVTYHFALAPAGYTVVCGGHFHRTGNFPQYNSVDGMISAP